MSLARKVLDGAGVVTAAGALSRVLSFATIPVLTPLLGAGNYGVAALIGVFVSLGNTLALLGIDMGYARFYMQSGVSSQAQVERFCWRFSILGASVVAATASIGWLCFGAPSLPDAHVAAGAYSALAIPLLVMVAMATTRRRLAGAYARIASALTVAAVVSPSVTLAGALVWRADFHSLLLGSLAGSVATLIVLGLPSSTFLVRRSALSSSAKRSIVALSFAGSVTGPMHWVISSSDRWFLSQFATESTIGVYSLASSVALVGMLLNSGLTLSWFPEASRLYWLDPDAALAPLGRLWERLVVLLAIVWMFVAAAGGDAIRLLAAPDFHAGTTFVPWLAGGVFFFGVANLANTAFLLGNRMQTVAAYWAVGALGSLGLNRLLIEQMQAQGAALTQCLIFALISACLVMASRSVLKLQVHWVRLMGCLGLALSGGAALSAAWSVDPAASLLLKLPVALLLGVVLIRLIARDWYRLLIDGVRAATSAFRVP